MVKMRKRVKGGVLKNASFVFKVNDGIQSFDITSMRIRHLMVVEELVLRLYHIGSCSQCGNCLLAVNAFTFSKNTANNKQQHQQ